MRNESRGILSRGQRTGKKKKRRRRKKKKRKGRKDKEEEEKIEGEDKERRRKAGDGDEGDAYTRIRAKPDIVSARPPRHGVPIYGSGETRARQW